jgi:hypothetical protein
MLVWKVRQVGTSAPSHDRGEVRSRCLPVAYEWRTLVTSTVLWIIAAILVIAGIVQLIQGQIILGIVLIVVGCLVGPGGYSIFQRSAR